jgi:hypothetical protein
LIIRDGNTSSTATGRDIDVNQCDDFILKDNMLDSSNITSSELYRPVDFTRKEMMDQYKVTGIVKGDASTSIATVGSVEMTSLSYKDIAFIDSSNDELRYYRNINGTGFALQGSGLSIAGMSGSISICALSSTRIAFIDQGNEDLRAYDWGGASWSQTGNDLNISGISTTYICALSSTRIALVTQGIDELRTYDFDGTDWAQTGNGLSITNPDRIVTLGLNRIALEIGSRLRAYIFDGTDWTLQGNESSAVFAGTSMTSLGENRVMDLNDVFIFDGVDWSVEIDDLLSYADLEEITALSSSTIAAWAGGATDELQTYNLIYGLNKLPTPPFTF